MWQLVHCQVHHPESTIPLHPSQCATNSSHIRWPQWWAESVALMNGLSFWETCHPQQHIWVRYPWWGRPSSAVSQFSQCPVAATMGGPCGWFDVVLLAMEVTQSRRARWVEGNTGQVGWRKSVILTWKIQLLVLEGLSLSSFGEKVPYMWIGKGLRLQS